jgi:hypothetical protein
MSLLKMTAVTTIALLAAGCASNHGKSVAEATPETFVTYSCDNSKSFSARFSAETSSVRVRTLDGSSELNKGDRGLYRDEAGTWVLTLGAANSTELVFKGKAIYTKCEAKG